MSNPEIFRPRSNYAYAGSIYILCIGLTGAALFEGTLQNTLNTLIWSALICLGAHLLFIRPKVTFFDEGILITNPLHEIQIGWGDIESIEARYTMYVIRGNQKIHAWAAPAPGRYHSRTIHPNEIRGLSISNPENMRPGESPRTHSGVATHLARLRLEAFRRGNFESAVYLERFDRSAVLSASAIFLAALLSLAF